MNLKNHKGASAVEFALVLPLLIVLVFGIIEFGVFLFNKQVITNASREGARAGIVAVSPRLTDLEIATIVNYYCSDHLITFGSATSANTAISRTGILFGDDLTVTVTYPYEFLVLPNFISDLAGEITLTAVTVMRYE